MLLSVTVHSFCSSAQAQLQHEREYITEELEEYKIQLVNGLGGCQIDDLARSQLSCRWGRNHTTS